MRKILIRRLTRKLEGRLQHRTIYLVYSLVLIGVFSTFALTFAEFFLRSIGALEMSFLSELLDNFSFFIDPGRITDYLSEDTNLIAVFFNSIVTISGILIFSTLIGAIAQVVDEYISSIRSGISPTRTHSHTVIIGYSPLVPLIILDAYEEDKRKEFVLYSDYDEKLMRGELASIISSGGSIVIKKGRRDRLDHAGYLNIREAEKVIILREPVSSGTEDIQDLENLQILLNLVMSDQWRKNQCSITVEMIDQKIATRTRFMCAAMKHVTPLNIPKIFVNTNIRDSLISSLVTNASAFNFVKSTLGFSGDEVHFFSYEEIAEIIKIDTQIDFTAVVLRLKKSVFVGLLSQKSGEDSIVALLPSKYYLQPGCTILLFAQNRHTVINDLKTAFSAFKAPLLDSGEKELEITRFSTHSPKQLAIISNGEDSADVLEFAKRLLFKHQTLSKIHFYNLDNGDKKVSAGWLKKSLAELVKRDLESIRHIIGGDTLGLEVLPCKFEVDDRSFYKESPVSARSTDDMKSSYCYSQIMGFGDKREIWFEGGPSIGDSIIGVHGIREDSFGAENVVCSWDQYLSNAIKLDCKTCSDPRGLLDYPNSGLGLDRHVLMTHSALRALNNIDAFRIVVIWFSHIGGDVHISFPKSPKELFIAESLAAIIECRRPKEMQDYNLEEELEVGLFTLKNDFDTQLEPWNYDSVISFSALDDIESTISIDKFSEAQFLGLGTIDSLSRPETEVCWGDQTQDKNQSLYQFSFASDEPEGDTSSALLAEMDSMLAVADDDLDDIGEDKCVYPPNYLYIASDKNTSSRIDSKARYFRANIGSYEKDTFAAKILSSLSVDSRNQVLIDALNNGVISLKTREVSLSQRCSLREVITLFMKQRIGSVIGYKLRSKSHEDYKSVISDFSMIIEEPISLIFYTSADERRLFAPKYWF